MSGTLDNFGSQSPNKSKKICGVDEAGRGPVMGPLVVCGLMIDDDEILKKLGARDSKKIAPGKREDIAYELKKIAKYEFAIMDASDIDVLRDSFSLNVIEAKLFASVIEKLGAEVAYVDAADSNEEEFARQINREVKDCRIISKHGADETYPRVSAASILAKTKRDAMMRNIAKELDADLGSGYPSDPKTINFLKDYYSQHGKMPPYTRMSWKTVGRLINELSMSDLDSFDETG